MKKFVPSRYSIWSYGWRSYAVLMIIIFIIGFVANDYDFISDLKSAPFLALILSSPLGISWLMDKYYITRGLIIDGESLIRKGLWKKEIFPQDIAAIKITRAVIEHRYGTQTDLTDKDGNQLYTMFLLKSYMPWAMNEKEGQSLKDDVSFGSFYREYTLCYLVYDQEVIDHLLRLNPNIVIC